MPATGLSSLHLDAFYHVARQGTFSKASKILGITQSALSQRIQNLEQELGTALFVRESSGVRLTDVGQELVRYCKSRESLEEEFLGRLRNPAQGLSGVIRIAGYSTI